MNEDGQPVGIDLRDRVANKLRDMWWTIMVRGLLAAALGLCALIWPTASLAYLMRLVGVYCLLDGATAMTSAM
jgi:uncharacterized membrane protein HdeD (DUF308 family)